ncbi:MAG TPA: hypothetical protein DEQ68_06000 [Ruminococcaceae bacterium]|nr:hypothetical protein [Oscillospiraceae bacterium]
MIGIECTLDDFKEALEALNAKLKAHHITIEIRLSAVLRCFTTSSAAADIQWMWIQQQGI